MKVGQGWAGVIRFDDIRPPRKEQLTPEQRAEHAACSFANEFIDIFNTQPLAVRLASVAKLTGMVAGLSVAALLASVKRLPYAEPNKFTVEKDGKRLPLIHFKDTLD